ncbi:MAG: hypothetical protein ACOY82_20045 [Pseudomonadota bacterium]
MKTNASRMRALFARAGCALASAALLLGIAGCEPEGAAGASTLASGAEVSAEPVKSPAKEAATGGRMVDNALEASVPTDMPPAEDVEITPIEFANDPEGNARFSVRFGGEESLPDAFGIEVDQRSSVFKRSEKDPRRFEGTVWFDFEGFAAEQKARAADLARHKEPVAPRFDGRSMIGEERLDVLDPELVSLARQNGSAFRVPRGTIGVPADSLDPARVLTITDLSVIEDPLRTYDICGDRGNPDGAWTFKTLMTRMANTPRTGVTPEAFVENWLKHWTTFRRINTHPVRTRMDMNRLVLDPWRKPDGSIDLDKAPFRLLAIVNRLDLRSNAVYGGGNGGNGGELRFVFGVVDRNADRGCSAMPFTVILEYGVPIRGCSAAKDYAGEWVALGAAVPGGAAYNDALQAITDRVTAANAAPAKPNGNAINQIRTNEIGLVIGRGEPWELRQFVIPPGESLLKQVSTAQTPDESYNGQPSLGAFMGEHRAQILGDRHVVPASYSPRLFEVVPLLSGATVTADVEDGSIWMAPEGWPVDAEVRHKFSLATCNGCHGGEARDNQSDAMGDTPDRTRFVHIDVRTPGRSSVLSKFLTGEGTLSAPSTFLKPDPAGLGGPHRLGDLLRRRQDLADFASGRCDASGLVGAFYVGQQRFTH